MDLHTKYPLVSFLAYLQIAETYLVPMGLQPSLPGVQGPGELSALGTPMPESRRS